MREEKYPFTYFIEEMGELLVKTLGGGLPEGRGPLGHVWFFLILFLTLVVCGALWLGFWVVQKVAEGIDWGMHNLLGTGLVLGILGAWWLRGFLLRDLPRHGRWENILELSILALGAGFMGLIAFALAFQTGNRITRSNSFILGVCLLFVTVALGLGARHFFGLPG